MLILLSLLVVSMAHGQEEVKRKYFGTYSGILPSYNLKIDRSVMNIEKEKVEVELFSNYLNIRIGSDITKGHYQISEETKEYYILVVDMDENVVDEQLILYKSGKKMERKGVYPQPDCLLFR